MGRLGLCACVLVSALALGVEPAAVNLTVDPSQVVGRVPLGVYGQFLEHIYHSVNGGLWGELVWSRSFEDSRLAGGFYRVGDVLLQPEATASAAYAFGDRTWRDYEVSFDACRVAGAEGFNVALRASRAGQYLYRFGDDGNTRHRLERYVGTGAGQTRWQQTENVPLGSLAAGRWYAVRLRVAGARVQVWLDGQPLLDYTDPQPTLTAGQVGLGCRRTAVRFRKLRVTTLDGQPLLTDWPAAVPELGLAPQWHGYGHGSFDWVKGDALNGDYCQLVTPAEGEAGVQQAPYRVAAGEVYHGSLWVRGDPRVKLTARLQAGDTVLAEADLGAPGQQWQAKVFTLRPHVAAPDATLQLGASGPGQVWLDQASLMAGAARRNGGYRPDLLAAVDALRPPVIRWPGGSFASNYRWQSGVGAQERRVKYPRVMWDDQDVNSFGTDEFVALCRRLGSEPLLVLNVGSSVPADQRAPYLQEALDWLEYCNGAATTRWGAQRAANGHPQPYGVKYWELDNEIWRLKPAEYVEIVKRWAPALKAVDPTIKLIACGGGQLGGHWADGELAVIEQVADLVDFLSIHHYEQPDNCGSGIATAEAFWAGLDARIKASKNPQLRLYVSEWNAQSTDWRTGLYAGGLLNAFERNERIGLAGPALFLRHVSATAWDNAFINFDHGRWFPAPNYVVMKLFRDHYSPDRVALGGEAGGLDVVATRGAAGQGVCVKLVNPTDHAVAVTLTVKGGRLPTGARLELVAPDSLTARNTLDAPRAVDVQEGAVDLELDKASCVLPRWAVGVLTLR